jgi:hypothetical protein
VNFNNGNVNANDKNNNLPVRAVRGGSCGPELYSFRALWWHYRNCRRNKRNTFNALAFEVDAEAKLLALQEELRTQSYRPGRSICFTTAGPKPREVFAADFRDRIVHHLLVSYQERVFLTSQFWGNVYLNELDQFVKRRLRCRYYLRYVVRVRDAGNDVVAGRWFHAGFAR